MSHHSIYRRALRLAPAFLIAAAAACTPVHRGGSVAPATLLFTNDGLYEAAVYVVVPGAGARRIGSVMAGQTATLVVPADVTSRASVNIVARLPGRAAPQTGPVAINAGQQYEVRLPLDARLLSFLPVRQ